MLVDTCKADDRRRLAEAGSSRKAQEGRRADHSRHLALQGCQIWWSPSCPPQRVSRPQMRAPPRSAKPFSPQTPPTGTPFHHTSGVVDDRFSSFFSLLSHCLFFLATTGMSVYRDENNSESSAGANRDSLLHCPPTSAQDPVGLKLGTWGVPPRNDKGPPPRRLDEGRLPRQIIVVSKYPTLHSTFPPTRKLKEHCHCHALVCAAKLHRSKSFTKRPTCDDLQPGVTAVQKVATSLINGSRSRFEPSHARQAEPQNRDKRPAKRFFFFQRYHVHHTVAVHMKLQAWVRNLPFASYIIPLRPIGGIVDRLLRVQQDASKQTLTCVCLILIVPPLSALHPVFTERLRPAHSTSLI